MQYLIPLIIIIGISLFLKSNKGKGIIGEWRVNKVLKSLAKKHGGLELHDFMFKDNRSSSQIDNMLLTQKALYVLEVKNYRGHIFGNESQLNWTVTVKHINKRKSKSGKIYKKINISKFQFYNPLKQNQTHINKIKNLTDIQDKLPIINIVVFGKNSVIRDVTSSNSVYVLHHREIKKTINNIEYTLINTINNETQIDIIDELYAINIVDKKIRKDHVKKLKQKYSK